MGPIELIFFVSLFIFGFIGIVRGVSRELGVTLMLLLGLMVLLLLDAFAAEQMQKFLELLVGPNEALQLEIKYLSYVAFLIFIAFISYEGRTISFASVPLLADFAKSAGVSGNPLASLAAGLINGYLLAGSIWYYLACADWPFLDVQPPFNDLYYALGAIMPPAIFKWQYMVVLVVLLLIIKVIR
jgi:hypothetical protein